MPSTVIRSIHYRSETRELEVRFTTGRCYLFRDVPAGEAPALIERMLKAYLAQRQSPEETFLAFTRRYDAAGLQTLFAGGAA